MTQKDIDNQYNQEIEAARLKNLAKQMEINCKIVSEMDPKDRDFDSTCKSMVDKIKAQAEEAQQIANATQKKIDNQKQDNCSVHPSD